MAYDILTGEDYPSWGHWFANGRVSLAEMWELDARSWTHHMYGSVDAWFYQYLAGIRPSAPGFTEISITPHLPKALESASAGITAPAGEVYSSWSKLENGYEFECVIPEGVKATFALPKGMPGISILDAQLVSGIGLETGRSTLTVTEDGLSQ